MVSDGLAINIPSQPRLFSLANDEMELAGTKEKMKGLELSFGRDREILLPEGKIREL